MGNTRDCNSIASASSAELLLEIAVESTSANPNANTCSCFTHILKRNSTQILFSKSEEGKEPCLDIMKDEVIGLQSKKLSIPHMGWNKVYFDKENPLSKDLKSGDYFYFVHSFKVKTNSYTIARTH